MPFCEVEPDKSQRGLSERYARACGLKELAEVRARDDTKVDDVCEAEPLDADEADAEVVEEVDVIDGGHVKWAVVRRRVDQNRGVHDTVRVVVGHDG